MNGDYQGLKRAHEEVVDSMINSQFANNNEPKKIKWDKSEAQPSKVVHIRNLPIDVIIPEIITLGAPFGRVDKHFCLKDKGQALLQLNDVEAAQSMVKFYQQTPPQHLRGKEIYVQFSHWQQIELNTPNGIESSAASKWEAGGNQTILWVVLQQPAYTVDLHVLYMIFTRFGKVLKIVTFTKNGQLQAFVQFSESKEAETALITLEREGTFAKVEYSRFNQLEVKENNEKSWDFTVSPSLPVRVRHMGAAGYDPIGLIANGLGIQLAYQPAAAALTAPLTTAAAAAYAAAPFGLTYPGFAQIPQLKYPAATSLAAATAAMTGTVQTPVLLVSRLNEKMITPDALFTLFGVYGDVMRVKILYNNKGCALIQMRDPQQVALAITNLNNVVLYGNEIRVAPSHHHTVQMPAAGAADSGLTKDYSNSPLHRFKKPGSKNFNNIYPPSSTLHLSNIPQNTSEEELLETFLKNDLKVVEFKFFPTDKRMALVQLASVEEAIIALIKMHDYKLSDTNHLRVSFSKAGIKNDRPLY